MVKTIVLFEWTALFIDQKDGNYDRPFCRIIRFDFRTSYLLFRKKPLL